MTPQEFVAKWKKMALKESASAQSHFNELCRLIGHPTPTDVDHKGEWFTFEAGASKQTGGQGWADVWKRGHFAWEYKGKHADLDKAYNQLLQYRESLENPPLLIVSDIEKIVIHTNFTNTVKRTYTLTLDDLLTVDGRAMLRDAFNEPQKLKAPATTEDVTEEAATEFARLAEILAKWGEEPEPTAHFLIRILFCLFAEDIGLLPRNLFSNLVQRVGGNSVAFTQQLRQLFDTMIGGGYFGIDHIAHFNGGLFDNDFVLELSSDAVDILLDVSRLDWSNIEPSILGTLFERSLDPSKRGQLGAHYTSKEDILLIVEPVLMAPLRRRWDEVKAEAEQLAAVAESDDDLQVVVGLLETFREELAGVQVLDPACGSGNFLYVALRQLLDLEKEVITFGLDVGLSNLQPMVSPAQLHGIEINAYAHELAQATVWIGYIQWLHENGFGLPEEPILKPLDTVLQMDAILAYDEDGNPVEPEWPEADVIIGNPPFLGSKKMRRELGDSYVDDLLKCYSKRLPGESDLVCYWFEKARTLVELEQVERVGLLATNSIRGGASRTVLERIKDTGEIFMAWSDRRWVLEGAAVRVSMVAFDSGKEQNRTLDGRAVERINPDLTSAIDLSVAEKLTENSGLSFMGVTPAGSFYVPGKLARKWLAMPNPNGRTNAEVVRPYYNGTDLAKRPRDVWIVDFGVEMPIEEASLFEAPFEYVRAKVKPEREKSRVPSHQPWWLFTRSRPAMRDALRGLRRYIGTSMVSKHHFFRWIDKAVIPANLVIVVARDDDYFLGVLQSHLHELWALKQGTALEDRPRYTPTTTFETFPFPWPPGQELQDDPRVQAIAQAARDLVAKRDAWLNPEEASEKELKKRTLTNLYNEYPTWLELAHRRLDEAALEAYGWPHDLTDEEILERLLELNLERAGTTN